MQGIRKFHLLALCLLAVCLIAPQLAWGQEATGAITGQITDPSGAPIAAASVSAKDVDRGVVSTTQTNSSGIYNLPRLPIGKYEVQAEAKGFETAVFPVFKLELNQTARVDIPMKVGVMSQKIEVTAAAPLLQTENTQLGTIIDSNSATSLSLPSRNYIQLTLLAPGSTNPNPQTMTAVNIPRAGSASGTDFGRPYVNGNREQANNFLLDGIDNNQVSDNLVGYMPIPDAIQEFNLITLNAPAEFGNYEGGIVSVSIKSGTNQFHGAGWEFYRSAVMDANQWQNNFTNTPRGDYRWQDFGGSIGGPIKKDKLFFFADYDGSRYSVPASGQAFTVFTTQMRNGDFSQVLGQNGYNIQLYNPFQIVGGNRVPFANNQIPLNLEDPVAKALFASSLYPAPQNNNLLNNVAGSVTQNIYSDQGDMKVDANLTDKDRLFVRFSKSRQDNPSAFSPAIFSGSFATVPTEGGVINWTHTLSPTVVNELRGGVNYTLVDNGGLAGAPGLSAQLGIQGVTGPGLLQLAFNASGVGGSAGGASGSLASTLGNANNGPQQLFANTVQQYEDQLIITQGRHIFHTGFQFYRQWLNTYYAGNNGRTGGENFTGRFTAGPNPLAGASNTAGLAEADFFLGLPAQAGRGIVGGTWGQRASIIGIYLQDDWRITNNLTMNLGLRYDAHTPWVEVDNRQDNFGLYSGAEYLAGVSGCPYSNCNALYNGYYGGFDFQPRIGFAFTPGGKSFVIRGAYTISSYMEGTGTNLRPPLNPPFGTETNVIYTDTLPLATTETVMTTLSVPGDPYHNAVIRLWNPNVRPAVAEQWSLTLQQQFGNSTTLQAGYVGEKGTHLMVPMPYLQEQLISPGVVAPSPFMGGNPTLQSDIGQISGTESNGTQTYNALQVVLRKRLSEGLQYQVAYTYSKCMSNSSGYYGSWGGQVVPTSPYFQNLYDMAAEWGPCYYDVTHVLTAYAVYDLPIGRNKALGKNLGRIGNGIAGNWQLSGTWALHGGFPTTITADDVSGTNSRGSRADCIAPAHVLGTQNSPQGGYQWVDPNAYAVPSPGTFGSCGVSTLRGPGQDTVNLSLFKEFPITESKRLQFRAESQNVFNTPILGAPGNGLGPSLGLVNTSQGARTIQVAIKFYY